MFQRQGRRKNELSGSSFSSCVLSGDENSAVVRAIGELDTLASAASSQVKLSRKDSFAAFFGAKFLPVSCQL